MLSRKGKTSSFSQWGSEKGSDDGEVCERPLPGDEKLQKSDIEQAVPFVPVNS